MIRVSHPAYKQLEKPGGAGGFACRAAPAENLSELLTERTLAGMTGMSDGVALLLVSATSGKVAPQ
jgi:hypothetical protein